MITPNRIIGLILIAFSGIVWFMAGDFPQQSGSGPGAAFFPQAMSVILIIIAAAIIVVNPETEKIESFKTSQLVTFVFVTLTAILYIILTPRIGFFVTTLVGMFLMMNLLEKAGYVKAAVTTLILTSIIYLTFRFLFNVPLPQGILF